MSYQLVSDNMTVTPSMVELVKEKMQKVEHKLKGIPQDSQFFRIVADSTPNDKFTIKINADIDGEKFYTDETNVSFENTLLLAIEELEKMVAKHYNKLHERPRQWSKKRELKRFSAETVIDLS